MRITFPILLIAVAVFGLGLGVSYAGGIATERARNGPALPRLESLRAPGAEATAGGAGAQGALGGPGRFGQRGGAGSAGNQGLGVLESLVGSEGRPLAEGTIEAVANGQITLRTSSSQTQVRLQDGAEVSQMVNGSAADLKPGLRVIIVGQRHADGTLVASRVLVPLPSERTGR